MLFEWDYSDGMRYTTQDFTHQYVYRNAGKYIAVMESLPHPRPRPRPLKSETETGTFQIRDRDQDLSNPRPRPRPNIFYMSNIFLRHENVQAMA